MQQEEIETSIGYAVKRTTIDIQGTGREQRISLTAGGVEHLAAASVAVAQIEKQMLVALSQDQRSALLDALNNCTGALVGRSDAGTASSQQTS